MMENQKYHKYMVPIVGGTQRYYEVEAPNKTIARMIAEGETHPWIHVKGKVVDLGEVGKSYEVGEKYYARYERGRQCLAELIEFFDAGKVLMYNERHGYFVTTIVDLDEKN